MNFDIKYQDNYSRTELILRFFFGWLYIVIPHLILLAFLSIWSLILLFLSFWIILFTGKMPRNLFDFQLKYFRWNNRVNARMYNLSDGYPTFGLNGEDEYTIVELEYPETLSRGLVLLRFFFAWLYVGVPHGFILYFRAIATFILCFVAFWVVLFTGKYPESWHEFNVGTLRWAMRLNFYLFFMTDEYPPFSGKAVIDDNFERRTN